MKTLNGGVSIENTTQYFSFDVEDDATTEEIYNELKEAAYAYVDFWIEEDFKKRGR
jgi:hypothetical protein